MSYANLLTNSYTPNQSRDAIASKNFVERLFLSKIPFQSLIWKVFFQDCDVLYLEQTHFMFNNLLGGWIRTG